jgi:hypothetical protein
MPGDTYFRNNMSKLVNHALCIRVCMLYGMLWTSMGEIAFVFSWLSPVGGSSLLRLA